MPHLKISRPPKHADKNRGSTKDLAMYLEKENEGKDIKDHELFFDHTQDNVFVQEVIQTLDSNKKGLKNDETKFYEMSISFSQRELSHIKANNPTKADQREAIQLYIRKAMDDYARHFERGLDGKDLVYFAKIEYNRRYHPEDKSLKDVYKQNYQINEQLKSARSEGNIRAAKDLESKYVRDKEGTIILPGNQKAGDNTHVHIIVSRRDRAQKISLSPLANSKGSKNKLNGKEVKIGFDRDKYVSTIEQSFDKTFGYDRQFHERYKELKFAKSVNYNIHSMKQAVQEPEKFAEKYAEKLVKDTIKKGISTYLKQHGYSHLAQPVMQMLASNKSALVNLASKQLSKDVLTNMAASKGIQSVVSMIPIPALQIVKAITVAQSLLSAQREMSKSSNSIER